MDEIDQHILYHLENQARLSMTELGKLVGLSQPAVTERVKRMEEKGIIEEYRTVISPPNWASRARPMFFFVREIVILSWISVVRHLKLWNVIG